MLALYPPSIAADSSHGYPGCLSVFFGDLGPNDEVVDFLSLDGDYELASAADGFEAGLRTATFRPDLLILDLVMPNMDGFRVCEAIRTSPDTRHIRILVVTGYPDQENIDRALRSGADCCMAKPFAVRELKQKVAELLPTEPTRVPDAGALEPSLGE